MTGRPDIETASLFPATSVSGERHKWGAAFRVAGAEKRQILGCLRQRDRDLPPARLAAVGKMRLFADTAAPGRSAP
jgi:hypothetical protein